MIATLGLITLCGCARSSPSPDQIRQQTANATAEAARDTKAIAQGIVEGLKTKGPLNINHASKDQLETLPGIDGTAADRIIAGRPYKDSDELLRRHIISRAEYHQIETKIETR
ncbi:MAG TPA: helix-hairpin-helix domain-containing protein [Acidobacteriaceae bacterium]|nr:helix-hairpin-helix domain-containing protein [Acidobacteriaceae bacterium]